MSPLHQVRVGSCANVATTLAGFTNCSRPKVPSALTVHTSGQNLLVASDRCNRSSGCCRHHWTQYTPKCLLRCGSCSSHTIWPIWKVGLPPSSSTRTITSLSNESRRALCNFRKAFLSESDGDTNFDGSACGCGGGTRCLGGSTCASTSLSSESASTGGIATSSPSSPSPASVNVTILKGCRSES